MKFRLFNLSFRKLLIVFSCLGLTINGLLAQKILISSHSEIIGNIPRTGLKTSIAFSPKKVADAWENYIKKYGKVSSPKGIYEVETAKIPAISDRSIRLVSKIVEEANTAYVFCSFDLGAGYISPKDSQYIFAEKFMKDFALKTYQDEYGEELATAEKTFNNAQKNQEKLIEKDTNWAKQTQSMEQEIADMERKIQERKIKIIEVNRQIEENKNTKVKAADEVERSRRMVEQIKVKLGGVN